MQTVYELAGEQAEPETMDEKTEDFAAEAKIEDQGFEESDNQFSKEEDFQPTSEEFSADTQPESFENRDSEEIKPELQMDEDFGLQPDDIDHFYKEPDYEDDEEEETAELPKLSDESEQTRFEEPPQFSETETSSENEELSAYKNVENAAEESETSFGESVETRICR